MPNVGLGLEGSAAEEPGGAELCSFAPVDLSLLVPADVSFDMSLSAADPAGAELCSLAPVDVSVPALDGF